MISISLRSGGGVYPLASGVSVFVIVVGLAGVDLKEFRARTNRVAGRLIIGGLPCELAEMHAEVKALIVNQSYHRLFRLMPVR